MTIKVVDQGEFRDDNRQSDDHEPPQNISSIGKRFSWKQINFVKNQMNHWMFFVNNMCFKCFVFLWVIIVLKAISIVG